MTPTSCYSKQKQKLGIDGKVQTPDQEILLFSFYRNGTEPGKAKERG